MSHTKTENFWNLATSWPYWRIVSKKITSKFSSQIAEAVSPFRRKSTTFPICKLWHRFQLHETSLKASKKWCYRSFEVALFRFLWTRKCRHWCETLQNKWTRKWGKLNGEKYLKCLRASLPVPIFPYGLSLVHMLSLLTTAPFTKELLSKL